MGESFIEVKATQRDISFEIPLRPVSLNEFAGQDEVRERLDVLMSAAKKRNEVLGHCLFSGPPGLGKTTLANIVAKTMQCSIIVTSGPLMEKPADLAGIVTNLQQGDILFIDEIHRMNRAVEEYLYSAMEDFMLDLVIDSGPSARTVRVQLNRFTLIGATTRAGLLTAPMRSRFEFQARLNYYEAHVLKKILDRSAKLLKLPIDDEGLEEIANRSRGTPRIANHLLRWVRDYASVRSTEKQATHTLVKKALDMRGIDQKGLDEMDKKILEVMIDLFNGGPVGIDTLAVAVGEEGRTLEEVHEPFLILLGFIKRTRGGRRATQRAYEHFGKKCKETLSREEEV